MAFYKVIILKGNYTAESAPPLERQKMALAEKCSCVVEFHYNAADEAAKGGEVYYQANVAASKLFAEAMWQEISTTGLPPHGTKPVKSTDEAPRSKFIVFYEMRTILLEPLFLSNKAQATWLHDATNSAKLADAITRTIKGEFPGGGTIGLSPGHAYKTSQPSDRGSPCIHGDWEVNHTLAMVDLVKQRL